LTVAFTFVFSLTALVWALNKETAVFKETLDQLQLALVYQDMGYINEHLSLDGVIKAKIDQLSSLAQKQGGMWKKSAAKFAGLMDKVLAKTASTFILREYNKSPLALRKQYQQGLKLTTYQVKEDKGFASGIFLGQPASLTATKIKDEWVVVSVESPLINKELKRILKIK
jgi:hypothetical protein